ncbi:DUF4012 domain-containing protein [Microbacterium sp.]|uniref:DUF4012 domain-containing protein n=1 Tax=Microbacterium sp. TaxID=51671 RepID=UPI002C6E3510|nr:DUF4012 domain-containing protein [Microbacterium sp.]HWL78727.1 DUF4012 domain-containing protein [Microbacterium sp.]
MPETPRTRADARAAAHTRRRTRSALIWIIAGAVVLVGIASIGVFAAKVAGDVFGVRDDLTRAAAIARTLPQKVIAGDTAGAEADALSLERLAGQALARTSGRSWGLAEAVPVLGSNLKAVRTAAESVDAAARFAAASVPRISLSAFQPVGGQIDMAAVHELGDAIAEGQIVFADIEADLADVDRAGLDPRVDAALTQLSDAVDSAEQLMSTVKPLIDVLPAALGEGGTHTYLLMFQGTSEMRALGGNPAAMALITVTDGRIALTRQITSLEFENARPESVVPLDAETENIYSDIIGRWIPNMTATPDFPTTVRILQGWWADEQLPAFDSVISIDPIALSYLLAATGPVTLDTGDQLTSSNAVSLLLNGAYFRYSALDEQDAFFASAAAKIFGTLTTGISNPVAFVNGLVRAVDEDRLKVWSSNADIASLTAHTPLAGVLPVDNSTETVSGVYFNDTTGSKMDYYVTASVTATTDQCSTTAPPTFTKRVVFNNTVTPEAAAGLPLYITGPFYSPGTIATDVLIYSPVGAMIESWTVSGAQSYSLMSEGTHLGRDVVRISVVTPPQTSATIDVVMKGAEGVAASEYGPFDVWTTPMVRDTPVTIDAPGCAAD